MTVWSGDLNFDTENKTRLRKLVKTQWTLTEKWKVPRVQEFHILCKYSPHLLYMNQACHVILFEMVFYQLPFCRIFFSAVKSNIHKTSFYVQPTTFDSGLTLKTRKKLFSENFLLKYFVFLFSFHVIEIELLHIKYILYRGVGMYVSLEGQFLKIHFWWVFPLFLIMQNLKGPIGSLTNGFRRPCYILCST